MSLIFSLQRRFGPLHRVRDEEQRVAPLQRLQRDGRGPGDGAPVQGVHTILHTERIQTMIVCVDIGRL